MIKLDTSVTTVVRQQEDIYPDDAGLLEALEMLASSVSQMPSEFSVDLVHGDPRNLWPDASARLSALLETVDSWMNYVLYVTASSARSLQQSIILGLNERDYLRCILAARAMLEFAGVVNQIVPGVSDAYARLSESREFMHWISVLAETSDKLQRFAQRTRFDWSNYIESELKLLPERPLGPRESIEKTINAIPQEPAGILYRHYRLMCDFVHPSTGMQNLFVTGVEVVPIRDGLWARYRLSHESRGDELLRVVLHVISLSTRVSLTAMSVYIEALRQMSLAHRSLLAPQTPDT